MWIWKQTIVVRSGRDRLRYTIMFEGMLIALLAPIGAIVLDREIVDVGVLSLFLSTKAMLFSLIYNWFYDRWDVRLRAYPDRPFPSSGACCMQQASRRVSFSRRCRS